MMKPYQMRVFDERQELGERIDKLVKALKNPSKIEPIERKRLADQLHHMRGYWDVLNARVAAFKTSPEVG